MVGQHRTWLTGANHPNETMSWPARVLIGSELNRFEPRCRWHECEGRRACEKVGFHSDETRLDPGETEAIDPIETLRGRFCCDAQL
jgi:hypothetical protein